MVTMSGWKETSQIKSAFNLSTAKNGEVATRRVARKRGVAVESPQVALTDDDTIQVNVTYIDDGRVLDTHPICRTPEHAIQLNWH